mmetsp:Transcript_1165/g.2453  ORF Transcript_1165/g.2453 Transcript_1165/m.2453 type:complete len:368 (-) Transcript_1165:263-1366(-)
MQLNVRMVLSQESNEGNKSVETHFNAQLCVPSEHMRFSGFLCIPLNVDTPMSHTPHRLGDPRNFLSQPNVVVVEARIDTDADSDQFSPRRVSDCDNFEEKCDTLIKEGKEKGLFPKHCDTRFHAETFFRFGVPDAKELLCMTAKQFDLFAQSEWGKLWKPYDLEIWKRAVFGNAFTEMSRSMAQHTHRERGKRQLQEEVDAASGGKRKKGNGDGLLVDGPSEGDGEGGESEEEGGDDQSEISDEDAPPASLWINKVIVELAKVTYKNFVAPACLHVGRIRKHRGRDGYWDGKAWSAKLRCKVCAAEINLSDVSPEEKKEWEEKGQKCVAHTKSNVKVDTFMKHIKAKSGCHASNSDTITIQENGFKA